MPLTVLRASIFTLKALTAFLVALAAFSFPLPGVATLLMVYIVLVGREVGQHLRKRTTAAYSTSDSQNQRLFNVTIFTVIIAALIAWGSRHYVQIGFIQSVEFHPGNFWHWSVVGAGLVLFCRYLYLVLSHFRTLLYLIRSYWDTAMQGKMRRFW